MNEESNFETIKSEPNGIDYTSAGDFPFPR